ncbi:LOW QUALITY PROTEIN: lysozyme g-like protein 1 [Phacochoerus africanus]|uniref:LOW QUALITY PROTEIN: lysozyme g-like protein 1 n=1 Tax=Phacochoerus africanus TaxID=41426 RepID=UPI001FDA23CA|nr:LOW QUALITY PROTEIN: lysozyme g-like protein 1 [Phacochoerus africanus]
MSVLWLLLRILALLDSSESSSRGCYGDKQTLDTPAASGRMRRRPGSSFCVVITSPSALPSSSSSFSWQVTHSGVCASERQAVTDMPNLLRCQPMMCPVCQEHHMDPAVMAGVSARESHSGNVLVNMDSVTHEHESGWCMTSSVMTCHNSRGPLHIIVADDNPGAWTLDVMPHILSKAQVFHMAEVLIVRIREIQRKCPIWTPDQYLKGGFCAYKGGGGNIRSSQDLNCDFGNDVLARIKYFKRQGF